MKPVLLSLALALLLVGCGESEFERTKRLAEGGDKVAQNDLGISYFLGLGVPQDFKEAVKWYRLAAEQGDANAQYELGEMYANGEGVPKDLVPAYAWLNVAQANGIEQAKKWREKLELNAKELAETQALLTEIQKRIEAKRKD